MPSFILIHSTVWPQYTTDGQETDRQTGQMGRQHSDSIGQTVLQMVAQKLMLNKQESCVQFASQLETRK